MAEDFISSVSSEEFDKALLGGLDAANGEFAKKEEIPTVPTKVSELENDAGYLKSFTEADPTVPAWAKESTKPSYTKNEVGLGNVDNVKQYSANNPPPYPVTSVNGKTGAVEVAVPEIVQATGDSESAVMSQKAVTDALIGQLFVSIPRPVFVKVGSEFRIYYRNVISRNDAVFWVGYATNLTTRYYDEYLSITPEAEETFNLPWKICDNGGQELDSGVIKIVAKETIAEGEYKVIVIGDSTVSQGGMTEKALELFESDGGVLNLYGTRGAAPNLTEGRAGWSAADYCTVKSDSSYTNPFYNNGFDFAYYMANQKYKGIQAVVVQLGINDIFGFRGDSYNSENALDYFGQIVSSILSYDSKIKVIVNLPSTPNSNGTSFTEAYGTTQLYWVYNRNIIRFAKELQEKFAATDRVVVSASNCVIDTKTGIRDGVHPNEEGYDDLGVRLYETLISALTGSEIVVDSELWDLAGRTASVNNYAPAANARTISNACYYYPCAYTGAWTNDTNGAYTVTDISIGENSLSFKGKQSAYGVFVPFLNLDSTKTYRFTVNPTVSGFRVYLMNYDKTGVYVSNQIVVDKTTGLTTFEFNPNAEYQQGFCFTPLSATANVLVTFTDLSLTEVTE